MNWRRLKNWRRLRCRPKTFFLWIFVIFIGYVLKPYFYPWRIDIHDWSFSDHNKCPACFGESLCPDLYHNKITLTEWTKYSLMRMFNRKNYFHAELKSNQGRKQKVILKKLGSNSKLVGLDKLICETAGQKANYCHPGHYIKALTTLFQGQSHAGESSLDFEKVKSVQGDTEVLDCLRSQRLLDVLIRKSRYHSNGMANVENILSLLWLNPEPVIFMTFPKEEGWQFPQYFGACGRLAMFEHSGDTLTEFVLKSSWNSRVKVARQLLQMAHKFTDNDLDIGLYLTDWSPDNFAVDRFGSLTLIDGESFILVDQKHVKEMRAPGWNVNHTNSGFGCRNRFCYSSEDLCTHQLSDLNLYGVCKGLLSQTCHSENLIKGGLLHSIPSEVMRKQPLVRRLIEECAEPSNQGGRYEAAKELLSILKEL